MSWKTIVVPVKVAAECFGEWAVHPEVAVNTFWDPDNALWKVTHMPTGCAIPDGFKLEKDAIKLARALARRLKGHPMHKRPLGQPPTLKHGAAIKAVKDELFPPPVGAAARSP